MFGIDFGDASGLVTIAALYGGVIAVVFWLAMIIWTYRDMRARSRDVLGRLFVTALVAILNVPGLLAYLLLRPRETLSEAYERSLEEEALLQEIEEKPSCPGCKQRVQDEWQACPHCHTRLKRPCSRCGRMLELSWDLCPHCVTPVAGRVDPVGTGTYTRDLPEPATRSAWADSPTAYRTTPGSGGSLEFIDGDDNQ
ncbi:MAG: zinc ribbon domain-containing protein [Chloroflexota bacterium]|nr:zinc ribbon domain-containing protein [Chloroflexota bacterium]